MEECFNQIVVRRIGYSSVIVEFKDYIIGANNCEVDR